MMTDIVFAFKQEGKYTMFSPHQTRNSVATALTRVFNDIR